MIVFGNAPSERSEYGNEYVGKKYDTDKKDHNEARV